MWRRRWPTSTARTMVIVAVALFSIVPGSLPAPTEDLSLEDTVRVLRHFSAGVSANRGAGTRPSAGHSHDNHRTQHPFRVELDSLEAPDNSREDPSDRESIEVTLGGHAVSHGGRFSSHHFVVGDDDDSFEIDEDDIRFINLGRRYHPDGVAPVSPRELFIPQLATAPAATGPTAPRVGPSLSNPFIIATASSSEEDEDNSYEDDFDDDDLAIYLSKNLLTVRGDDSSEERLELDDALLGKRYNFIDGQGSTRWGYDLVDQYQHQTVNTDGSMKGRFGWTAPNGQEIKVQYVADDGGYRLIESSGIPSHSKVPGRHSPPSVGVPLSAVGDSYKVTVPFGGVPLPDPASGGGSFGTGGVPLPSPSGPGTQFSGSSFFGDDETIVAGGIGGGVPLPSMTGVGGVSFSSAGTGGVPLPTPSGSGAASSSSSFFGGDDETVVFGGGGGSGVPLPGMSETGGTSFSSPGTGGVPLPSPSGSGGSPSGSSFFGDSETVVIGGGGGGVPLPGGSFSGTGIGGVPLPSPSGPGSATGSSFFGNDETVVLGGGGGGLPLPGMSGSGGVSLSSPEGPLTGGVPLPSPSGPGAAPSGSSFFEDDERVVVGGGGSGISLPGTSGVSLSSPGGFGTGGVPLPAPPGPGAAPSGSAFFGEGESVVFGGGGGVGLPGTSGPSEVSPSVPGGSGIGGVPLPSPSGPGATPSGSSFFGDDETVVVGGGGGGALLPGTSGVSLSSPGMPGIGGVPLPSPSGPDAAPSDSAFFGEGESVVFGGGGGVGLPGTPEPGEVSLSSPGGPGTGGVSIPSPFGPDASPSGIGISGDEETVLFGGSGGVSLPGMSGAGEGVGLPGGPGPDVVSLSSPVGSGVGGVSLPSPSGPESSPSGSDFLGNDETVVFGGGGGGVTLPGAARPGVPLSSPGGPETGGVPLPSFSSPGIAPSEGSSFGADGTIDLEGVGGVGLAAASGPGGVSLSSPTGPSTTSSDDARPEFGDSSIGIGTTGPGFGAGGETKVGISLPGFGDSATEFGASGPGSGTSEPGFGGGGGVSLPGFGSSGIAGPVEPEFDDSIGFGVSGAGSGVSGSSLGGGGVSLSGFGSSGGAQAGTPFGASAPDFGPGTGAGGGVPLSGFDSSVGAGVPDFGDSISIFGAPEPSSGASGSGSGGGGVSLPGFGSFDGAGGPGFDDSPSGFGPPVPASGASATGFGRGEGVSLPVFGSSNGADRPGFDDSASRFGASGPASETSAAGFGRGGGGGGGVSLPGFASSGGTGAGGPEFDGSTSGFGAAGAEFDGGVPLSVIDPFGNLRPGSSGFENSAHVSGSPGTALPGFGEGGLDASEVPLQGPPVPGTFSLSTNLGQGAGTSGVPLSIAKDMSFNKFHPSHAAFPFFEVGPPEHFHQAAGGPTKASPFPHHPDFTILDTSPHSQFPSPSGPDSQPDHHAKSSVNSATGFDKPQDLVKVYSEIYGIKMKREDWAAPGRREAPPANLELPNF